MPAMLFAIPPAVQPSALLSACKDTLNIDLVAIERMVAEGRKVRWVVLLGGETDDVTATLTALVKAAGEVVVVLAHDDHWRVFALTSEDGRLTLRFDDFGERLRRQRPALTLKERLAERTSEADAADVSGCDVPGTFDTDAWLYFERPEGSTSSFSPARDPSRHASYDPHTDGTYALDFPEVYDWEQTADDAPEEAPEPTRAELIARFRSGTAPKAKRRFHPLETRNLPPEDPSRKKPR